VRQLSRSLLPIQFSETGLEAALREMTAYFSEFTTAGIALNCCGDSTAVPGMMAHHIHQILHEALYRAICKIKADDISVRLHIVRSRCKVLVRGRIPCSKIPAPDEFVSDIMKYRIGLIGAQHAFTVHSDRGFSLACEAALSTEETE
jgi:nitrate/nitrite-specific signal transduction histidine kinase